MDESMNSSANVGRRLFSVGASYLRSDLMQASHVPMRVLDDAIVTPLVRNHQSPGICL